MTSSEMNMASIAGSSTSLNRQRQMVRDYLKFGTDPEAGEEEPKAKKDRFATSKKHSVQSDDEKERKKEPSSEESTGDDNVKTQSYQETSGSIDYISDCMTLDQHPSRVLQKRHARRSSGGILRHGWDDVAGPTRSWALRLLPTVGLGMRANRTAMLPPVPSTLVRLDNRQKLWPASIQFDCLRHGYHLVQVLGTGARARVYLAHRSHADDLICPPFDETSDEAGDKASDGSKTGEQPTKEGSTRGSRESKTPAKKKLKYFAIKCVDMPEAAVEEAAAEMRAQVWAHHQVNNYKHVARLYQYFEGKGRGYYVHEYCRRGSLQQVLRTGSFAQQRVFPEDEARNLLTQICTVLRDCHHLQLVHSVQTVFIRQILTYKDVPLTARVKVQIVQRTLRLHSILLDDDYNVKIGNWVPVSSCKVRFYCDDVLDEDIFCAPEMQNRVCGCTKKANMWSVGVILYVMLVGHLPYDVTSITCQDSQRMQRVSFPDNVPKDARLLIRCLLQWRPEKRPSAHEALQHPWVTGEKVCWPHPLQPRGGLWAKEKATMLKPAELRIPTYPSWDAKKCMAFTFHSSEESIALKSRLKTHRGIEQRRPPFGGKGFEDADENCLDLVIDINDISKNCLEKLGEYRANTPVEEMTETKSKTCPFCQIIPDSTSSTPKSPSSRQTAPLPCGRYFFLPLYENSLSFIPNKASDAFCRPKADKLQTILARLTGKPPKDRKLTAQKAPQQKKTPCRQLNQQQMKTSYSLQRAAMTKNKEKFSSPSAYVTQEMLSSAYNALTHRSTLAPFNTPDETPRDLTFCSLAAHVTSAPQMVSQPNMTSQPEGASSAIQVEQVAPPSSAATSSTASRDESKLLDHLPASVMAQLTNSSHNQLASRSAQKVQIEDIPEMKSLTTVVVPNTSDRYLRETMSEAGY